MSTLPMDSNHRRLWSFHGGLKLDPHKAASTRDPIATAPLPAQVILPLQQHIGEPAEPVVAVGDRVGKGQLVARTQDYIGAHIHASTSGTVVAIEERRVPHPSGLTAPCIVIEADGRDAWVDREPLNQPFAQDPAMLRRRVHEAGIVGLGGAGFPAHVKLHPGADAVVDTLILNAAECEPYISCDDMLCRERAEEVLEGLLLMRHALQARHCLIGIEDSMPEASAALRRAIMARDAGDTVEVVTVPTVYPTGGEKQLIKVLTGREVPSDGLPLDIGIVSHNVGTAVAVYRAIVHGEPLLSRIVTVTGAGVAHPRNWDVRLGTPMADLIRASDGYTDGVARLIMGGPMMGFALPTDAVPVIKTTNCILAATTEELPAPAPAMPCIRCGDCVTVCPANLLPQQLYWFARAREFDKAEAHHLFDCIECGACAYVCPSHIPLVQYYRYAKTEIQAAERERRKADLARQRHQLRQERLEREKAERAERLKKKKATLKRGPEHGDHKQPAADAVAAAVARAKARKQAMQQQAGEAPAATDGGPDESSDPHPSR